MPCETHKNVLDAWRCRGFPETTYLELELSGLIRYQVSGRRSSATPLRGPSIGARPVALRRLLPLSPAHLSGSCQAKWSLCKHALHLKDDQSTMEVPSKTSNLEHSTTA